MMPAFVIRVVYREEDLLLRQRRAESYGGIATEVIPAFTLMRPIKDTLRATVRLGYDGKVHKTFRGPNARERFDTETKVLRYLEERACPFVPRLLSADPDSLTIVTSSCGTRVDHLDEARAKELFEELKQYGVRHDDAEVRNVTYRQSDGRFCLIDFEFATILSPQEQAQ